MATYDEHVARARRNEEFAGTITRGDWKIIVTFYAAVHYIEAVIVQRGFSSSDHKSRGGFINSLRVLKPIATDYSSLSTHAWTARYRAHYDYNLPEKTAEVSRLCALLDRIKAQLGFS